MKLKILFQDKFQIMGVMTGGECPSEDFIYAEDANTSSMRQGLIKMLGHVATSGLSAMPHAWSHEANKEEGIYEFIKGDLRLFFFKGVGTQIAVCTAGTVKKGSKADKKSVAKAIASKKAYFMAVEANTCEVLDDEDE